MKYHWAIFISYHLANGNNGILNLGLGFLSIIKEGLVLIQQFPNYWTFQWLRESFFSNLYMYFFSTS